MKGSDDQQYSFSYTVDALSYELTEYPSVAPPETIPLDIFAHASTMQALARYLVDKRRMSFTQAARRLHRSPKSLWASYHQTGPLPDIEESLPVPIAIFTGRLAPLEALTTYLKGVGLRNVEIAQALRLDPRTIATCLRRAEVKA